MGNAYLVSHNAKGCPGTERNFSHAHQRGHYPATSSLGLGRPIAVEGLSDGVNNLAISDHRNLPAQEPR